MTKSKVPFLYKVYYRIQRLSYSKGNRSVIVLTRGRGLLVFMRLTLKFCSILLEKEKMYSDELMENAIPVSVSVILVYSKISHVNVTSKKIENCTRGICGRKLLHISFSRLCKLISESQGPQDLDLLLQLKEEKIKHFSSYP